MAQRHQSAVGSRLRGPACHVAFAFLQTERMRLREGPQLTFPQGRVFVQEIFTGRRPQYMRGMKQADQRFRQLRTKSY